jgi:hypothetical protein
MSLIPPRYNPIGIEASGSLGLSGCLWLVSMGKGLMYELNSPSIPVFAIGFRQHQGFGETGRRSRQSLVLHRHTFSPLIPSELRSNVYRVTAWMSGFLLDSFYELVGSCASVSAALVIEAEAMFIVP